MILDSGQEIIFARTSFKWSNLASRNAGVTVVVVGFSRLKKSGFKQLYSEVNGIVSESAVENINPYLINAPNIFVSARDSQMSKLPVMLSGDKMTDGGHLVLSYMERNQIISEFPFSEHFIGRLYGGQEIIKGVLRFAFLISDQQLEQAKQIPMVSSRLISVSKMRSDSSKATTQLLSSTPHKFDESRYKPVRKVVVAQLSSETRSYYPCKIVDICDVAMAPSLVIYNDDPWLIGLLCSRLHTAWIATVCGKLETRYRYSNTLGWNTFPVPLLTEKNKADLTHCAEEVLLARESHFPKTIADLYDPDDMPDNLREAHELNDEVLERIYIGRRFKNDTERLEKLFELYTKMTEAEKKPAKSRKKA